jgi:hypothetical protein
VETTPDKLETSRERLIEEIAGDVKDERVLDAMRRVPREEFVPAEYRFAAYENFPLQIGYDQTISQPLMVGVMTAALMLTETEKVLEIGTGSGYQAAVLSLLAAKVVTVERIAELAESAAEAWRSRATTTRRHAVGNVLNWRTRAIRRDHRHGRIRRCRNRCWTSSRRRADRDPGWRTRHRSWCDRERRRIKRHNLGRAFVPLLLKWLADRFRR